MANPLYAPPDWIMLGIPEMSGGVNLFASTKLSRAQLEQVANYHARLNDPFGFEGRPALGLSP